MPQPSAGCLVACRLILLLMMAIGLPTATVQAAEIETVPIGNPGNPADLRYLDDDHPSGVGAVAYSYRIGKTEITNAQYAEFLNAVAASDPHGLYDPFMGIQTWGGIERHGAPGGYTYTVKAPVFNGQYVYANQPVIYVSWYDALRFANWLHNGQPVGGQNDNTTEDGAYTFSGPESVGQRNPGALWWLPSEDEWYKAAYHKNDGVTGNYWDFPAATNSTPNNNQPADDTGNSANFFDGDFTTGSGTHPLTSVGAYMLSASAYNTFDQGGSVTEWTETRFSTVLPSTRGGAFTSPADTLRASTWFAHAPTASAFGIGFRVAAVAIVPEPDTVLSMAFGAVVVGWRRRRIRLR